MRMRYHFTQGRITHEYETENTLCCWVCLKNEIYLLLLGMLSCTTFMENSMNIFQKKETIAVIGPSNLILAIYC